MYYLNLQYCFIALFLLYEIGCMNICLVKRSQLLYMVIFQARAILKLHITLN